MAALSPLRLALYWVVGLTVMRLVALQASGLELHGDEAQYWSWAKSLDLGYFTKPPLIAWIIAATTAVCGDGEACVRAASPLLHAGTALALFGLARAVFGAERGPAVGLWAAVIWISLPSVALSSVLISTDVPLLLCWTLAVAALRRLLDTRAWAWAATAGVAIGLGLLAKYAMAYALAGLALHLLLARDDRWLLRDARLLLVAGLALLILAPNLVWNAQHDFATVGHLKDNANLPGLQLDPLGGLAFLGEQAGVFGPLPLLILGWRLVAWARGRASDAERYLLAFALPPLAVITMQAVLSRANANWAATAYPTATVLVAAWLTAVAPRWLRLATVGPHLLASLALVVLVALWPRVQPPYLDKALARLSGWQPMARELRPWLDRYDGLPVLMSDRMTMAALLYYLRDRIGPGRTAVWMWDWNKVPENHYEMANAYDAERADPVLLITDWPDPRPITLAFEFADELARLSVERHGRRRELQVWRLSGYRGH